MGWKQVYFSLFKNNLRGVKKQIKINKSSPYTFNKLKIKNFTDDAKNLF